MPLAISKTAGAMATAAFVPAIANSLCCTRAAADALLAFWPAIFAGIVAQKMWMLTTVPSVYTSQAVFLWLMPSKSLVPDL